MASETNVKINLKTVAQTGDAEKLVAIIKALGKSLKEAGGEDAKELRGNLAPMLKELAKGGVSADRVKGMAGQVAKVQALGSISALNAKLSQFGTAQARIIQRTVADIKAAVMSGDLTGNTMEVLSAALAKFVEEANKLPPAGLERLGGSIRSVVEDTRQLQSVIAKVAGIDFKVGDGDGSAEALEKKIKIVEEASDLADGVKDLAKAGDGLGLAADLAEEFAQSILDVQDAMSQKLDDKGVKNIAVAWEKLQKTTSKFSGKQLAQIAPKLDRVRQGVKSLGESVADASGNARLGAKVADTVLDQLGVRVDQLSESVTGLVKKIPGIGRAFSRLGALGGIIIAAIIAGITKCYEKWCELQNKTDEIKFEKFTQGIRLMEKEMDAVKFKIQEHYKWRKAELDIIRDQRDAVRELAQAQREASKEKELRGVEDSHERAVIENRHSAAENEEKRELAYENERRRIEDLKLQIEQKKKDVETAEKEERRANKNADAADTEAVKWGKEASGWIVRDREHKLQMQRDNAKTANDERWKAYDAHKEKTSASLELEEMKKQLAELTKRDKKTKKTKARAKADADYEAAEAARQDREIAERRRVEGLRREQRRDDEVRDREGRLFERSEGIVRRDAADTEREHRRSVAEPYQDIATHLKTAEKELERFTELEKKAVDARTEALQRRERALAERQKILDDFKRSGRAEMTAEERFRFDEATRHLDNAGTDVSNADSDLSYARQHRYQEQGNVASLKKQLRDRRIDKEFSDYDERREDSEWRRQGRYSRANYAQRLKMDEERYEEGVRQFEAAEARIRAANAGTRVLTPEERRLAERERAEGRRKMTESRESIRSALYEGDSQKAGFVSGLMRNGNRLTQMGLGGDVANWDRKTADNTRRLVQQTKEILTAMNARGKYGNLGAVWGM